MESSQSTPSAVSSLCILNMEVRIATYFYAGLCVGAASALNSIDPSTSVALGGQVSADGLCNYFISIMRLCLTS